MEQLRIDKSTFQELVNVNINLYHPLKRFNSYQDFENICTKKKMKNGKFFPIPILFGISNSQMSKIKNSKKIQIIYKNEKIALIRNFKIFKIDQKKYLKKIYGTNDTCHPGVRLFLKKKYFIDGDIIVRNKIKNRYSIKNIKNYLKSMKYVTGYHTRNIPHKGHEWIINFGLKKTGAVFINPITGNLKRGDFKKSYVNKAFRILIKSNYKDNKNIFFENLSTHARYAGPREALFHAIIRKNYGCSHFLVGRDHAGVGSYYKKYESQRICKKYEKKIGLKIISFKEPFYCKYCKKVINSKCKHSNIRNHKVLLSGTKIREKILKKQKIPNFILDEKISKILTKNSIRGFNNI